MFKPSEIVSQKLLVTTAGVDMAKVLEKFNKDEKHLLAMGKFKIDGKSAKLVLEGDLTTNGVAENKWSNPTTGKTNTTCAVGIALSDEDLEFFESCQTTLGQLVGDDYELTTLVKNDIIYLKVKDKKVFNAMSNVKADKLFHGQKFATTVEFKFYINLKDEKAGVVLHPVKYVFEETD